MTTLVLDAERVSIPDGVEDLQSFRRWAHSDDFPEAGRICFFHGEVWVDMSKEQIFTHNQVKNEYNIVLGTLARTEKRGRYFPDGLFFSNDECGLATEPDGAFAFFETLRSRRARLIEGAAEGFVELTGTLDMALEVVSASSVEKDTEILRDLYWQAGIEEYWLVDVRGDRLEFDILKRTARGYVAVRKQGGWLKSAVFGKSFRLTRGKDPLGNAEFSLHVR